MNFTKLRKQDRVFIIAEAGVNHNGRLSTAKRLVDEAKKAGCDAIKFQTFKTEHLVSQTSKMASYQKKTMGRKVSSQFELLKQLELSLDEFRVLQKYCRKKGILFLSTPFDDESIDFIVNLRVPIIKIPSGEVTNHRFLQNIAKRKKWMILSTGMATLEEVKRAVRVIKETGNKKIVLMHCTTAYPAPFQEANLRSIVTLEKVFKCITGYSDHTVGIEASIAAVALGARVIEKHFTLDKSMRGPDHKASLDPRELGQLVNSIRHIEDALGHGVKRPTKSEKVNIPVIRKSILAKQTIAAGSRIEAGHLVIKRPGTGISPERWKDVIGRMAKKTIKADSVLVWSDLV